MFLKLCFGIYVNNCDGMIVGNSEDAEKRFMKIWLKINKKELKCRLYLYYSSRITGVSQVI